MANLCIIPARGGSKRIPKKNIKDFLGKPIIAYSIEAAINCKLFDEIMVSTDDWEIAKVATCYGAKVPFTRSEVNSNDFATTFEVIEEVLCEYSRQNMVFETVCCLYPCSPLITAKNLIKAFRTLDMNVDAVIPIVHFSFPIQRAFKVKAQYLNYIYPENEKTRSQDLEKTYHDAGQFYFFKTKVVVEQRTLVPPKTSFIELSEMEAQDIDDEFDWKMAELKYQLRPQ